MKRETFLIILLIIFYINVTKLSDEINYEKNKVAKIHNSIRDSLKQLVGSIIKFFNISLGQLEARRRKIKKGFLNFIDVSFKDKKVVEYVKTRRFSNHFTNMETGLSTVILSHGHHIETHSVLTVDGYILTLHKIKPKDQNLSKTRKTIVLLQHGLFGSSADWLLLGPEKSLPYILSRSGCEVWLANSRGNIFSKSHVSKTVDSPEFWDFSMHEIGLYDLSATLEYIFDVSHKKSEIIVIGHSSGGAALLVLLSMAPRYNSMLKLGVLLAPLVFVSNAKGALKYVNYLYNKNRSLMLSKNGNKEFIPNGMAFQQVTRIFFSQHLCKNILTCLRFGGKGEFYNNFSSTLLDDTSSGGSEKVLIHYFQMMKSGHFRNFDSGGEENIKDYGQLLPPRYKLQDISLPIILFTSSEDCLSTPEDISVMTHELSNIIDHTMITSKGYSHIHFIFDDHAAQLVYNKILPYLG